MAAPNTVILNFSPGVVPKGDTLGRKLFAVTFLHKVKGETDQVVTHLWRGGTLNGVKQDAKDYATIEQKRASGLIEGLSISVGTVLEIGSLR